MAEFLISRKKSKCRNVFFVFAFVVPCVLTTAQKQKNIALSEELIQRADQLPVKMGTQWMGKVWKMDFGEYSIGESKNGATKTSMKGGPFSRKSETVSSHEFSFELKGSAAEVANVRAIEKVETKELEEWVLSSHFSIGEDELLLQVNNFTALISLSMDTSNVWTLIMTTYKGKQVEPSHEPQALLTNGKRRIYLNPITSVDDKRPLLALGYELREENRSHAALQFYGGGMMGLNKNIIWLPRNEDPSMKLILAATLSTVLQFKVGQVEF
jgi:hypothetical protein